MREIKESKKQKMRIKLSQIVKKQTAIFSKLVNPKSRDLGPPRKQSHFTKKRKRIKSDTCQSKRNKISQRALWPTLSKKSIFIFTSWKRAKGSNAQAHSENLLKRDTHLKVYSQGSRHLYVYRLYRLYSRQASLSHRWLGVVKYKKCHQTKT